MDAVAAIARTTFSLVAVLGLLYLISRWLRRRTGAGAAGAGEFSVLSRQSVGPKACVALVQVGQRALVVGVTEQGVNLLGETDISAVFPEVDLVDESTDVDLAAIHGPGEVAAQPVPSVAGRIPAKHAAPASGSPSGSGTSGSGTSGSALSGSALSPATWTKAVDVLRERTTRR